MGKRMLNKELEPTFQQMVDYCGETANLFLSLNDFLKSHLTTTEIDFPYGNKYGWGVKHKIKSKLICNVFPKENSFNVMLRLQEPEITVLLDNLSEYGKNLVINGYPCSTGKWIHYEVDSKDRLAEIFKILLAKGI